MQINIMSCRVWASPFSMFLWLLFSRHQWHGRPRPGCLTPSTTCNRYETECLRRDRLCQWPTTTFNPDPTCLGAGFSACTVRWNLATSTARVYYPACPPQRVRVSAYGKEGCRSFQAARAHSPSLCLSMCIAGRS